MAKKDGLDSEGDVLERCRRVRAKISRKYPTADKIYEWFLSIQKKPARVGARRSQTAKKSRHLPNQQAPKRRTTWTK
ncbi:MAG TPA: hypothetical protein VGP72_02840 [Planctomycetota bacterium]|jgi:hypothetical protein